MKAARIFGMSVLFLAGFVPHSFPQQSLNVAVFDFQKTIQDSSQGQKVIAQLKEKETTFTQQLNRLNDQILSLQNKLKVQKQILSFEAQKQISMDLDRLVVDRSRLEEDSTREYQQLKFELLNRARNEVFSIVQAMAIEKQFSLVLEVSTGGVAFFDPTLDITEEVIRRYNEAQKKQKAPSV